MKRHHVLTTTGIITPDGVVHRPYDFHDGGHLVLACELASPEILYLHLRRFEWKDLAVGKVTTCLGCLCSRPEGE